jgi:hypothetical protein
MNKKYLRIESRPHKFKVWGLNYKFGGQFDQTLEEWEVWRLN